MCSRDYPQYPLVRTALALMVGVVNLRKYKEWSMFSNFCWKAYSQVKKGTYFICKVADVFFKFLPLVLAHIEKIAVGDLNLIKYQTAWFEYKL